MWIYMIFSMLTSLTWASQFNYPSVSPSINYNLPALESSNYVYEPGSGRYLTNPLGNRNLFGSAISTGTLRFGSSVNSPNFANIGNTGRGGATQYSNVLGIGPGTAGRTSGSESLGQIIGGGIGQFLKSAGSFWNGGGTSILGGKGGFFQDSHFGQNVAEAGRNVYTTGSSKPEKNTSGFKVNTKPPAALSVNHQLRDSSQGIVAAPKYQEFDNFGHFIGSSPPENILGNVRGEKTKSTSSGKSGGRNGSIGSNSSKPKTRENRSGDIFADWKTPSYDGSEIIDTETFNQYLGESVKETVNSFNAENGWNTNSGLRISSPPPVPPPIIRKHIYVHLPPSDEAPLPHPTSAPRAPVKHYKIIFIKAPSAPPPPPPVDHEKSFEKTLVYVLFNRPEYQQKNSPKSPVPTEPSKPEVFFIRYKNSDKEEGISGSKGENQEKEHIHNVESHFPIVSDTESLGDLSIGDSTFYNGEPEVTDYREKLLW